MTESNEPEKKDETAEPTEAEPIIDLKDEMTVDPADDEETIDLTEIIEASPVKEKDETIEAGADSKKADEAPIASQEELKGDEEIIDLLQAIEEPSFKGSDETVSKETTEPIESQASVMSEKEIAHETKDEEAIIDLVDAAEDISLTDKAESVVEKVSELPEDEAVINLTEAVTEPSPETEDIGEPISEAFDLATEFDDISELDSDLIKETAEATDGSNLETTVHDALEDDFVDSLGIELDSEEEAKEKLFNTDKVTNEQIEAAVERVIKKMFYEKIDRLLVDTIEKTVTREIERLKKALLDNATDSAK